MRRIGLGVGTNSTAIYRYFRGKADLLEAVSRSAVDELERSLLGIPTTIDPRRALLAMGHTYLAFAFSEPRLYRLALQEGGVGAMSVDRMACVFTRETSRLFGGDGRDAAFVIVTMLHGLATLMLRFGERDTGFDWRVVEVAVERIVSSSYFAEPDPKQPAG